MELEKQKFEIEKLKREIQTINLSPWLQAGTLLAALLAAAISFWSAWRSQKSQALTLTSQIKQQQKDRMSDLLRELGSEQPAVKIASIQALSEYEAAAPFLVNVLKVDAEHRVFSATVAALQAMPEVALPLLLNALKDLYEQHLNLAAEMFALGKPKHEICQALILDNKIFTQLLDSSRYKRINESIRVKVETVCKIKNCHEDEVRDLELRRALDDWGRLRISHDTVLKATERLIETVIKLGKSFSLKDSYLQGVVLDNLDLSGWVFENTDLRDASFNKAICSGVNFTGSTASRASFREANLRNAKFDRSILKEANFDKAFLIGASFGHCEGYAARFRRAKMNRADFRHSRLAEALFDRCIIHSASFKNAILYRAKFTATRCKDGDFTEAKLTETELKHAIIQNTCFDKAEFHSTVFASGRFESSTFNGSVFRDIAEFGGASFHKSTWDGADFSKNAMDFFESVKGN